MAILFLSSTFYLLNSLLKKTIATILFRFFKSAFISDFILMNISKINKDNEKPKVQFNSP